jgi:ubiquinone/menaquinone biosynthesis C-methylase UbiE
MSREISFETYGGNAAENYERYFVPAIGAPLASDLVDAAALRTGERVLDVACGTGVVARLAARHSEPGKVAAVDINPGMLAVARENAPATASIEWHEGSAEALPFADEAFDVVLCQMGLQFFPDKLKALQEMLRVLAVGGRVLINVPGPTPPLFAVLEDALTNHLSPDAAGFVRAVFSLHDPGEIRDLVSDAGFTNVDARSYTKTLRLSPPEQFLWQYVHSTPLAAAVAELDESRREALEHQVVAGWQAFSDDGGLLLELGVTVAQAQTSDGVRE